MPLGEVLPGWYLRASRRFVRIENSLEAHRARWMITLSLGTWLPLVALAALGGVARIHPDFDALLIDLPVHARLLLAIPLLVDAAIRADRAAAVTNVLALERVTSPDDVERLRRSQASFDRHRTSVPALAVMVALAIAGGVRYAVFTARSPWPSWLHPPGAGWLSAAGLWYCGVCAPVVVFLLLRVIWRWAAWVLLLVRLSRLRLELIPSHADNAGGLGMVGVMPLHFSAAVAAVSSVMAMTWLKEVLFHGAPTQAFLRPAVGLLVLMVLLFFAPALVFIKQLTRAKLKGLHDYGLLVFRTNSAYERRWLPPDSDVDEFLGRQDAGTVADLAQAHEQVEKMWVFPFRRTALAAIVAAVVVPMLPLPLAALGVRELLKALAEALI
jgi:hypothetical protein